MANTKDIILKQGANFKMVIDYRNPDNTGIDLSGYTFRMQIKSGPGGTLILDASTSVTRDSNTQGRINVNIPASQTANLDFVRGVYDILITAPNGEKHRIVQGIVVFDRQVTT